MIEKFSDFEGQEYLNQEGEFKFKITSYELTESKSGNAMAKFECSSEAGCTTIYHTLLPKARWSYNNLIKACLHLNTKEKIEKFELDYETIGQQLVDKEFIGVVEAQTYEKPVKRVMDDGTFMDDVEIKESYKITSYKEA